MCRNIRPLFNYEPPVTSEEIRAAATQYVRKVSGTRQPSAQNRAAFDRAIEAITQATSDLVASLETKAPPKDRKQEAEKARSRHVTRFG